MKKTLFSILLIFIIQNLIGHKILAPATPSSLPIIIAAEQLEDLDLEIFKNHTKAHSLFLRGETQLISTGLSVGQKLYKQKVPLKVINSYVNGLTFLITRDKKIDDFSELKGSKIYVPFKGSPIFEITDFFIKEAGLDFGKDIEYGTAVFPTSLNMLKQGKIDVVVFPEPFVSLATQNDNIHISLDYKKQWEKITETHSGYPQVAVFSKASWIENNEDFLKRFNLEIEKAISLLKNHPEIAVKYSKNYLKFPGDMIRTAAGRTSYNLLTNSKLEKEIKNYYKTIGRPLDETYKDFFYSNKK